MALSGSLAAAGEDGADAAGSVDAAGRTAWKTGFFGTIATWLPANTIILSGALVSASGVISGFGLFSFSTRTLGVSLASAVGSTDAAAIANWTDIGNAILSHLETNGKAMGTGLSAPPLGGPVVGVGSVVCPVGSLGTSLASAAQSVDAPGIAGWNAVASVLADFIATANFLPAPIPFVAPPSGPIVGTGTII